ncbi:replication endonuclease, partial [Salmonella enterica subsp. enterica serovar Schwarzengrund]|nr:replication endonuclease [Salmonella enterica subsp. enterica serovar Schwarzengrund]
MTLAINEDCYAVDAWRRETFAPGTPADVTITERLLWAVNPQDHKWRAQYLHEIPDWLAGYFGRRYEKLFTGPDGRRRANTFLRQTIGGNVLPRLRKVAARYKLAADAIDLPFGKSLERLPSLDRPELKKLAGQISGWISQSLYDFTERFDSGTDDPKELHRRTMESYRYLCACSLMLNNQPPYWAEHEANAGQLETRKAESGILRMMAPEWWYLRLKRARDVQREHMAIAVGQVQKAASAYVSRKTLGEWIEQKKRNLEFFKKFDLLNDEGLRIALDSMVHRSVANPAIRRCELMVRMRGFEDMANEEGLAGEFYTITAPSRFHAVHSKGGFVSQWDGSTPQDTQRYLCGVWAKARAAISRAGIHVFGFRVVEPHHDGTPHWHMLLFMRPQDVDTVRDILCYHARITDSEELQTPNALKARFHVEAIDPAKGSATGYIAKYIS